jgi:hypothetical protein
MTERPILFSAPMVRALLDGSKTQTRRAVSARLIERWTVEESAHHRDFDDEEVLPDCPYGRVGDRLWVKETCALVNDGSPDPFLVYRADRGARNLSGQRGGITYWMASDYEPERWRPSIHMPRWASRITLEITEVRVERLQDISAEDFIAEGLATTLREHDAVCHLRDQYRELWESINGAGSWDANPWVWVVSFPRFAS